LFPSSFTVDTLSYFQHRSHHPQGGGSGGGAHDDLTSPNARVTQLRYFGLSTLLLSKATAFQRLSSRIKNHLPSKTQGRASEKKKLLAALKIDTETAPCECDDAHDVAGNSLSNLSAI